LVAQKEEDWGMKNTSFYRTWIWLIAIVASMVFGIAAMAADEDVIYKKKTVYNFEDDTITGDLTRPDQEFLTGRRGSRHKSLITVREDFKEKVLESVGDLQ
jgi:hypothetical protein